MKIEQHTEHLEKALQIIEQQIEKCENGTIEENLTHEEYVELVKTALRLTMRIKQLKGEII